VPAVTKNFAYISSGTWSLVGLEVPEPTINPKSLAANLTNEGGVEGTVRLLKNVTGLWLVQECRRIWATEGDSYSYAELAQLAQNAPPSGIYVDPDSMRFLHPDHMPRAIQEACRATNQTIPDSKESILRCIFESLALKYRYVLQSLEGIHGKKIDTVHIIGGGSQNELLNQLTSDASGKNVVAGPVEATALGNALVQAVASGLFNTIWDGRKILSEQLESKTYTPVNASGYWDEAYSKFVKLMTLESV